MKNFLDISEISKDCLKSIVLDARRIKNMRTGMTNGTVDENLCLKNFIVGLIFEQPSTRTRVSFEVGVHQMGGKSMSLLAKDLQLGNGESISDTARVLSLYLDMLLIRTSNKRKLLDLAAYATVPVINGLTDQSHPCQVMADIMTFEELKGSIKRKKVVWVGDGNNVCTSYIHAAVKFDFNFIIASPNEFSPDASLIAWAKTSGAHVEVLDDVEKAVKNADLVVTDTHLSMHDKGSGSGSRLKILSRFKVDGELMSKAKKDAIFMHCLPAYRNVEVTQDVIDGPQSAILQVAQNRLHIQKAIMKWCINIT